MNPNIITLIIDGEYVEVEFSYSENKLIVSIVFSINNDNGTSHFYSFYGYEKNKMGLEKSMAAIKKQNLNDFILAEQSRVESVDI